MRKIAKLLQERFSGTLPRFTETNPPVQVKAITTRSGKTLTSLTFPDNNEVVVDSEQVEEKDDDEAQIPRKSTRRSYHIVGE